MHPLGPFAVCCYSVFKDHPGHLALPDSRAAQGCDEVRNLTKSKQPVNNFLPQIIRFTALLPHYFYHTTTSLLRRLVHIKCAAHADRGKLLNQQPHVNGKNEVIA